MVAKGEHLQETADLGQSGPAALGIEWGREVRKDPGQGAGKVLGRELLAVSSTKKRVDDMGST
jgi:hypothetical protein